MKRIVEIVVVEGITSAFATQIANSSFMRELRRLVEVENSFEYSRLTNNIVIYRNLKPSLAPQDSHGTYAYIINDQAEVEAFYSFKGLPPLM